MDTRIIFGVLSGTLALGICQYFSQYWVAVLLNSTGGDLHNWRAALAWTLGGIASVLPGFFAGFFSGRRGFLVGAVVGVLGSFLYGIFVEPTQVHAGALKLNAHTWTAVFIFPTIYGLGLTLTSAVGGAAGQLLRSNPRLERP
jgi:MFS family permease